MIKITDLNISFEHYVNNEIALFSYIPKNSCTPKYLVNLGNGYIEYKCTRTSGSYCAGKYSENIILESKDENLKVFRTESKALIVDGLNMYFLDIDDTRPSEIEYEELPSNVFVVNKVYQYSDHQGGYLIRYSDYNFNGYKFKYLNIDIGINFDYEVSDFYMYRDGGTINCKLTNPNTKEVLNFYSPTLFRKNLNSMIDDIQLIEVTDDEYFGNKRIEVIEQSNLNIKSK